MRDLENSVFHSFPFFLSCCLMASVDSIIALAFAVLKCFLWDVNEPIGSAAAVGHQETRDL